MWIARSRLATTGHDIDAFGIDLLPDDVVHARYAAMKVAYPDPSSGFVYATARAPAGSAHGRASP
jgi:hypothetical protein